MKGRGDDHQPRALGDGEALGALTPGGVLGGVAQDRGRRRPDADRLEDAGAKIRPQQRLGGAVDVDHGQRMLFGVRAKQGQGSAHRHAGGVEGEEPLRDLADRVHRTPGGHFGQGADEAARFGLFGVSVQVLEELVAAPVVRQRQERPVARLAQPQKLVGDGLVVARRLPNTRRRTIRHHDVMNVDESSRPEAIACEVSFPISTAMASVNRGPAGAGPNRCPAPPR